MILVWLSTFHENKSFKDMDSNLSDKMTSSDLPS